MRDKVIDWTVAQAMEFDDPRGATSTDRASFTAWRPAPARVIYGNVQNRGLIDNLPQGCAVEVPCLVDANGIQPDARIGALPAHLAALIRTQVNVQELTVQAALTRDRRSVYHAAMLDPHTAAELDLDQIWRMVDDLLDAHQRSGFLPRYE